MGVLASQQLNSPPVYMDIHCDLSHVYTLPYQLVPRHSRPLEP
jgi:hypothetical protein